MTGFILRIEHFIFNFSFTLSFDTTVEIEIEMLYILFNFKMQSFLFSCYHFN